MFNIIMQMKTNMSNPFLLIKLENIKKTRPYWQDPRKYALNTLSMEM